MAWSSRHQPPDEAGLRLLAHEAHEPAGRAFALLVEAEPQRALQLAERGWVDAETAEELPSLERHERVVGRERGGAVERLLRLRDLSEPDQPTAGVRLDDRVAARRAEGRERVEPFRPAACPEADRRQAEPEVPIVGRRVQRGLDAAGRADEVALRGERPSRFERRHLGDRIARPAAAAAEAVRPAEAGSTTRAVHGASRLRARPIGWHWTGSTEAARRRCARSPVARRRGSGIIPVRAQVRPFAIPIPAPGRRWREPRGTPPSTPAGHRRGPDGTSGSSSP